MSYDAIVAGAGPAGSTAARLLAEQGASLLLGRQRFRRDKPCGGQGARFERAVELIKNGDDIDYEGSAGPIEFNAERDNVRGAVEIWHVDPETRALPTWRSTSMRKSRSSAPVYPCAKNVA